jgi:hypothetical protein
MALLLFGLGTACATGNSYELRLPPPEIAHVDHDARAGVPSSSSTSEQFVMRPGRPQPDAYALIIGISTYRDVQPPVPGATNDAEAFQQLAKVALGVPEENMRLALGDRATFKDIERHVSWLQQNVPANGRVYVYFSGHGTPDPVERSARMVPYDADATALTETSLSLDDTLSAISRPQGAEVIAFVDSCFSGAGGRSVLPKGSRAAVPLDLNVASERVVLYAAAGSNELAGSTPNDEAGLFTSELVRAVGEGTADMDGDGQVTLAELDAWVGPRVEQQARRAHRQQRPEIVLGHGLTDPTAVVVLPAYVDAESAS